MCNVTEPAAGSPEPDDVQAATITTEAMTERMRRTGVILLGEAAGQGARRRRRAERLHRGRGSRHPHPLPVMNCGAGPVRNLALL